MRQLRKRRHRGFTLLEMVLVLIILATIAGLVIPQLGFLGRSADMAATAKSQQDIANQLSLYFTLQKRMPQRLDSLLTTGATPTIMPELDAGGGPITTVTANDANNQRWGFPIGGSNSTHLGREGAGPTGAQLVAFQLTTTSPTLDPRRSFTRLGFDALMDHEPGPLGGVTNANNSGTFLRDITSGDPWVASVVPGSVLAQQIYPASTGVLPTGVAAVVAVGIGPRCSLVPDTMLNAPSYPGSDSYYGRYIAYFAVFNSGERAQLVGVSDCYGRFPNYTQQQFNESLPNNGRQG